MAGPCGELHLTSDPAGRAAWEPLSELSENEVIFSRPDNPHPAYFESVRPDTLGEVERKREALNDLIAKVEEGRQAKLQLIDMGWKP